MSISKEEEKEEQGRSSKENRKIGVELTEQGLVKRIERQDEKKQSRG